MSKHTPGPWRINAHNILAVRVLPLRQYPTIVAAAYCPEQSGESMTDAQREEWDANALLIAAAPDLLAAAKEYAIQLRMNCDSWGERKTQHPDWYYMTDLEALIAKAEGCGK